MEKPLIEKVAGYLLTLPLAVIAFAIAAGVLSLIWLALKRVKRSLRK